MKNKKCKVCGNLTGYVFNINFKQTHICNDCARCITLQQIKWMFDKLGESR